MLNYHPAGLITPFVPSQEPGRYKTGENNSVSFVSPLIRLNVSIACLAVYVVIFVCNCLHFSTNRLSRNVEGVQMRADSCRHLVSSHDAKQLFSLTEVSPFRQRVQSMGGHQDSGGFAGPPD